MKKLSSRQEVFAQHVAAGKTQAEAYRLAYPGSEKWKAEALWSKASAIMARDYIQGRVKELQDAAADAVVIDRAVILREAFRIATFDMSKIIRRDAKNSAVVMLPDELDPATRAGLASFEIDEYGRIKYKPWDKNSALDKLFKHLGLYEADNAQKPPPVVNEIRLVPLQPEPDKPAPK